MTKYDNLTDAEFQTEASKVLTEGPYEHRTDWQTESVDGAYCTKCKEHVEQGSQCPVPDPLKLDWNTLHPIFKSLVLGGADVCPAIKMVLGCNYTEKAYMVSHTFVHASERQLATICVLAKTGGG